LIPDLNQRRAHLGVDRGKGNGGEGSAISMPRAEPGDRYLFVGWASPNSIYGQATPKFIRELFVA
jgi:hypothetical protein